MKAKILSLILMIAFVSCGQKQKSQQTENQNVAVDSVEDTLLNYVNKSESYYEIIKPEDEEAYGNISVFIKNVTFTAHLGKEKNVIFRQTQTIKRYAILEGQESKIDVDILDLKTSEKKRSFSVVADEIDFDGYFNCYLATKYGMTNEFEMGELWKKNVFLRCENNVFIIKISPYINFYLGFMGFINIEKTGIAGELTFIHQDTDKYSYTIANKLILKIKDNELRKKYIPISTEIDFIAPDREHSIREHYPYKILTVWNSYQKSFSEVNLNVLKIVCEISDENNDEAIIEIPIQNGYLFGNKSKEQIIYLDDYIKKN